MNEHVQEYVRRIHEASGMPSEQALDAAGASPRSRALALDSTPGGHLRGLPFHNAAVRAGRNVNLSVCLMPWVEHGWSRPGRQVAAVAERASGS